MAGTEPISFQTNFSGHLVQCWIPRSYQIEGVTYVLLKELGKGAFSRVYLASDPGNKMVALKLQRYISPAEKMPKIPQLRTDLRPSLGPSLMKSQSYVYSENPSHDNIPTLEAKERLRCLAEVECSKTIKARCDDLDRMGDLGHVTFSDFFVECYGFAEFLIPIVPIYPFDHLLPFSVRESLSTALKKASDEKRPTWNYAELHFGVRIGISVFQACEASADDKLSDHKSPFLLHERINCALQIAQALEIVRRCGIRHRDLKAGNVLLREGRWKLIDFGISHLDETVSTSTASFRDLSLPSSSSSELAAQSPHNTPETDVYCTPQPLRKSSNDLTFWSQFILQLLMDKKDSAFDDWKEEEVKEFGKSFSTKPTQVQCDQHFVTILLAKASDYNGLQELIDGCIYKENFSLLESSVYMTWRSILDEHYETSPSSLTLQGLLMFIAKQSADIPDAIFDRTLSVLRQMIENNATAFSQLLENSPILSDIITILRKRYDKDTSPTGPPIDGLLILERCLSHLERSMSHHQLRTLQQELYDGKIVQFITKSLLSAKKRIPDSSTFAAMKRPASLRNSSSSKAITTAKSSSSDSRTSLDKNNTSPFASFSSQYSSGDSDESVKSPYSSGNLSLPVVAVGPSSNSAQAEEDAQYLVVRIAMLLCVNNPTYRDRFFKNTDLAKRNFSYCLDLTRKYESLDTLLLLLAAADSYTESKILNDLPAANKDFIDQQFAELVDNFGKLVESVDFEAFGNAARQAASLVRLYARTELKFWAKALDSYPNVKSLLAFFRTSILPQLVPYLFDSSKLNLLKQYIPELDWDIHKELVLHIVPRLSCYPCQIFNQSIRSLCLNRLEYPEHIGATPLVQYAMKFQRTLNCKCQVPDPHIPGKDPKTLQGEYLCLVCAENFQVLCKTCFGGNMVPFLTGPFVCANHLPYPSTSALDTTQNTQFSPEDVFVGCCGWEKPVKPHWIPSSSFDYSLAPIFEPKGPFEPINGALTCSSRKELSTIQIGFSTGPPVHRSSSSSHSTPISLSASMNGSEEHLSPPKKLDSAGTLTKFMEIKIATPGQVWLGFSSKELFGSDGSSSPTLILDHRLVAPFLAYNTQTGDIMYSSEDCDGFLLRSRPFGVPLGTTSHLGIGLSDEQIFFIADDVALPPINFDSLIGFPTASFLTLMNGEGTFTVSMSHASTVAFRRYTESRLRRVRKYGCPLKLLNQEETKRDFASFPPESLAEVWYSRLWSHLKKCHSKPSSSATAKNTSPGSQKTNNGHLSNSTPPRMQSGTPSKSTPIRDPSLSASDPASSQVKPLESGLRTLEIQPTNQEQEHITTNDLDSAS